MKPETWFFDWPSIRGELAAPGGMLGPVWFTLPDGREVQPFAVGPWADDTPEMLDEVPPILRSLRGEFPCVPFGVPKPRSDLPPHWSGGIDPAAPTVDAFVHGYGANHDWYLVEQHGSEIAIAIDYPENHPVRRLKRRISRESDCRLTIELTVEARQNASLPVGVHPIFALPGPSGSSRLDIPSLEGVRTFPVPVEEGSILMPDQFSSTLTDVEALDGSRRDISSLPLDQETEELMSVQLSDGFVRLAFPDGAYAVDLTWDIRTFPHCLLWLSNQGRKAYPWNRRFRALGIEPVCAAFDLGTEYSTRAETPFTKAGMPTSIRLEADVPFTTVYSIGVSMP